MGLPGFWEMALIFGGLVLLFGGKKLPQLGGAIGESIKNFKKGLKETEGDQPKAIDSKTASARDDKHTHS